MLSVEPMPRVDPPVEPKGYVVACIANPPFTSATFEPPVNAQRLNVCAVFVETAFVAEIDAVTKPGFSIHSASIGL